MGMPYTFIPLIGRCTLVLRMTKGNTEESESFEVDGEHPHLRKLWLQTGTEVEEDGDSGVQWSLRFDKARPEEKQRKLHVVNTKMSWWCLHCDVAAAGGGAGGGGGGGFKVPVDLWNHQRLTFPPIEKGSSQA